MLAAKIKSLALEFGFDAVGITHPGSLAEGERAIHDWVREGRHGTMKYLEEFEARKNRFYGDFPDAKSVIVLGVNYYSPHPALSPTGERGGVRGLQGRVARYAWGRDYHEVIRANHEELINRIREISPKNFRAKSCVDTQAIPERFAAQRAGLGFVGKNTMLLSKKFGPWLFLSEIVTNLELEEDLPDTGDCGTCDRCQKICPTGALDEDYRIDARKCIAYLTIEHKGVIPRELRPKIKDWVFGCDECLTICPFTSHQKVSGWKEFSPSHFDERMQRESSRGEAERSRFSEISRFARNDTPSARNDSIGVGPEIFLEELFDIRSNREYEKKFSGSAVLRASRKQMLRNACIVLGNSGRPEAIPLLEKALHDPSPLVRLHAAWGLGQLESPKGSEILETRYREESDARVREEIECALAGQSARAGV